MSQENVELARRFYEWRHGRAVRVESFRTQAEALEALGLSD